MSQTLNSITLNAPASPVSTQTGQTFTFSGTPGFSGTGGVNRYDWKFEVNPGSGYVALASSGTGLTTSTTNPATNLNSTSQRSCTVTCAAAGSYTIRISGAPATGGAYSVTSSTQTVTVTAVDALTGQGVATAAPSVATPTIGQKHALSRGAVATAAPTAGAPTIAQTHELGGTAVATAAPSVGTPTVSEESPDALTATDVATAAPAVGTPELGQEHALAAESAATGAPAVGDATLGQEHALGPQNAATGAPSVGEATLGQEHALEAQAPVLAVPIVGQPLLDAQAEELEATDLATDAPTVGTPTLATAQEVLAFGGGFYVPPGTRSVRISVQNGRIREIENLADLPAVLEEVRAEVRRKVVAKVARKAKQRAPIAVPKITVTAPPDLMATIAPQTRAIESDAREYADAMARSIQARMAERDDEEIVLLL